VWQLAATTPGVLRGTTTDIGLSFRGAGQREIQNSLTMDGINASSNLLSMTSMRPMADAVTEVQVQTGSTSAEYGAYLGVHVNVVTKAGTNDFHGALFEYLQDDALESRGYFDNLSLPEPPKRSNQFGLEFDGPVAIPGLYDGRNKTFFMAAYEGLRSNRTTSPIASVPTERMRRGDFSEISAQIVNPITKQPYPGNQIPQAQLSQQALQLLQYYPLPNLPGTANGTGNNYQAPALTESGRYAALLASSDDLALLKLAQPVTDVSPVAIYRRDVTEALPAAVPADAAAAARDTLGGAVAVAHELPAQLGATVLGVAQDAFVAGMQVAAALSGVIAVGVAIFAIAVLRDVRTGGHAHETADDEPQPGRGGPAIAEPC